MLHFSGFELELFVLFIEVSESICHTGLCRHFLCWGHFKSWRIRWYLWPRYTVHINNIFFASDKQFFFQFLFFGFLFPLFRKGIIQRRPCGPPCNSYNLGFLIALAVMYPITTIETSIITLTCCLSMNKPLTFKPTEWIWYGHVNFHLVKPNLDVCS